MVDGGVSTENVLTGRHKQTHSCRDRHTGIIFKKSPGKQQPGDFFGISSTNHNKSGPHREVKTSPTLIY